MPSDQWRIVHEPTGWCIYRNRRIYMYDFADVDEAMATIKRRAGRDVKVKVVDEDGSSTIRKT